jgi:hypothetical protein
VIILLLIALVLLPVGFVLILMGMWERKSDAPSVSGAGMKHWFTPFWKQKSWFLTSRAYRRYFWGNCLLSASFFLNFLYFSMKLIHEGWR